jgi:hypothetical protein
VPASSFWRASMYYRSAEYFSDPFIRDGHSCGLASREVFLQATALSYSCYAVASPPC